MAAPIAYEEPTINRAWQAFEAHLPTFLLIWVGTISFALMSIVAAFVVFLILAIPLNLYSTSTPGELSYLVSGMSYLAQLPFLAASSMVAILMMAVPAMYYETGEKNGVERAMATLFRRPLRYLLAGFLFTFAFLLGLLLCLLPGIVIALTIPVYVNRIFNSEDSVIKAFLDSFQAVYGSERGFTFIGLQLLAFLCVSVTTVCTCFIGILVALPVATFYIQNGAYRQGVLR